MLHGISVSKFGQWVFVSRLKKFLYRPAPKSTASYDIHAYTERRVFVLSLSLSFFSHVPFKCFTLIPPLHEWEKNEQKKITRKKNREKKKRFEKSAKSKRQKLNSFQALPFGTCDGCQFSSWFCSFQSKFTLSQCSLPIERRQVKNPRSNDEIHLRWYREREKKVLARPKQSRRVSVKEKKYSPHQRCNATTSNNSMSLSNDLMIAASFSTAPWNGVIKTLTHTQPMCLCTFLTESPIMSDKHITKINRWTNNSSNNKRNTQGKKRSKRW